MRTPSPSPLDQACSFYLRKGTRWLKMAHVSGVVWEGEGFVGQQYPTFNAPVRKKWKITRGSWHPLVSLFFLLCTAPPRLSHTWFKIIQPVSVRRRALLEVPFFFPDSWCPDDNAARISLLFTWQWWCDSLSCLLVNPSCWSWSMF